MFLRIMSVVRSSLAFPKLRVATYWWFVKTCRNLEMNCDFQIQICFLHQCFADGIKKRFAIVGGNKQWVPTLKSLGITGLVEG